LLIGTGKSFLIQVICDPDSDDLFSFAVVAPTGLAAYNVNDMTMHRFFKLPVQHGSGINNWNLRHEDLKQLRH
jgi:ATP-dependent DNA helicase PIF1